MKKSQTLVMVFLLLFSMLSTLHSTCTAVEAPADAPIFKLLDRKTTQVVGGVDVNLTFKNIGPPAVTGSVPIPWEKIHYLASLSGSPLTGNIDESMLDFDVNGDYDKSDLLKIEYIDDTKANIGGVIANAIATPAQTFDLDYCELSVEGKDSFMIGSKSHVLWQIDRYYANMFLDASFREHSSPNIEIILAQTVKSLYDAPTVEVKLFNLNGVPISYEFNCIEHYFDGQWEAYNIYVYPLGFLAREAEFNVEMSIRGQQGNYILYLYINWSPDAYHRYRYAVNGAADIAFEILAGYDSKWLVGVKPKDYAVYDVEISSNDPELKEFSKIFQVGFIVESVSGTNVTATSWLRFKNGTELSAVGWFDIRTWEGGGPAGMIFPMIVVAGLSKGDRVADTEKAPLVTDTTWKTYLGVDREVNYIDLSTIPPSDPNMKVHDAYIYFDRLTGIVCEIFANLTEQREGYLAYLVESIKIKATNVFGTVQHKEVKIRGYITSEPEHTIWSAGDIWYLVVEISEVLWDPTGNLSVGDEVFVEVHVHEGAQLKGFPEGGPRKGDYVEVYGDLNYELWAEKQDHYLKKIKREGEAPTLELIVDEPVPHKRFFYPKFRVTNLLNEKHTFSVRLVTFEGFEVEGDNVKELTLNAGESGEVEFQCKIYGGYPTTFPLTGRVFDEGGNLLVERTFDIAVRPEFSEFATILAPVSVRKGETFTVGLPVFHSYSRETLVVFILRNLETGKSQQIQGTLTGEKMESLQFYSFTVDKTFADLNKEGVKEFEVEIDIYFPEENRRIYDVKQKFSVLVSNDLGTASIMVDANFRINLVYEGKKYVSLRAYNTTSTAPPQTGDLRDKYKWQYSMANWLIFDADTFKPVSNDEVYKTLALASEAAILRTMLWHNEYLFSRSKLFSELRDNAMKVETIYEPLFRLIGKALGILLALKASIWASTLKFEAKWGDVVVEGYKLTAAEIVQIAGYLQAVDIIMDGIKVLGGAKEDIIAYVSVKMLGNATKDLDEANKLLTDIRVPSTVLNVDVDEALKFYSLVQKGESEGLAGMHFLAARYSDQFRFVKEVLSGFIEGIPLVGTVYQAYELLKTNLNDPVFHDFFESVASVYASYEKKKEILQDAALKFRDKFISERLNCIEVTVKEPEAQRKLHLTVFDDKGRLVGFNRTSGALEVNIPECYYLDLGNAVKILLPEDTALDKVIIDAAKAEQDMETYNLIVEIYENGTLIGTSSVSGNIQRGASRSYLVEFEDGLKPAIEEIAQKEETRKPAFVGYVIIGAILTIIAIVVVTLFVVLRRKHRPVQASTTSY